VRHTSGADCQHPITNVALYKAGSGYLVECHGCASVLGVVSSPREFQALRRAPIKLETTVAPAAQAPKYPSSFKR
jgi:hypothetical protein